MAIGRLPGDDSSSGRDSAPALRSDTASAPASGQSLDPLGFPLRGSRLIEASAGTGKTFTLALLYIRLILGHGRAGEDGTAFSRALTPPEILVVTFTDAATQELRERIRERLVEAAELFSQPPELGAASGPNPATAPTPTPTPGPAEAAASDDPLQALRASYPASQWPACARLLRQAAEWMDEAMIATIHAWCQRMLQEHAFATRGLFERELVTDQTELIAETLRDYWRMHCYPRSLDDARCIRTVCASPAALQQRLGQWLERRDATLCYQGAPLSADTLEAALAARRREIDAEENARALWREHRSALEAELRALRPNLNSQKYGGGKDEATFERLLAEIARWAEGAQAPKPLPRFAQGQFVFLKNAPVKREPQHPAFAAIADWQRTQAAAAGENDAGIPPLEAALLAHAADWVSHELPRRLRTRAEMGYDELLRDLDAALTPSDGSAAAQAQAAVLAATIRRQFPVALIDEFQDTDPIQYRIFDAIYRVAMDDPETALIMIGDPKQAIYGFRGADIYAYLTARRATEGRHATLATNYRSTEAMVAACNHFFGHAETQDRGAFRFHTDRALANPIPYVPIRANGRDERLIIDGEPATAMTFWQLDDGEPVTASGVYLERMAAAAAAEIARWLAQARAGRTGFAPAGEAGVREPLKPRDIAILVRTGSEAAVMRQALAALRINSVYLSDRESVFQSQEAADLLHWLRACAEPTDEGLVGAALGTNTMGVPLAELAQLQQDELAWEAQVEQFADYHRTWQRQGVLAMLRRLMHEQDLPARLLGRSNGERVLTNLLHLAEWLQQSAAALDGEQALIRHLSEHLDRSGDEFIVRLESDADLVQVITMHKSKGLEYPLVLLPFICSWRAVDGNSKQVPYRVAGQGSEPAISGRALEVAGKNAFPAAWETADDERLSEDVRRLYVAVTRARHAVWLGIAPLRVQGNSPQLHQSAIGHVLNGPQKLDSTDALLSALQRLRGACPHIAITGLPDASAAPLASQGASALEPARAPEHAAFRRWWIASYSALSLETAHSAAPGSSRRDAERLAADTAQQETALEEAVGVAHAVQATETGIDPALDTLIRAAPGSLHELPRGSRYGTFLHGLLEWCATLPPSLDADGSPVDGFRAAARLPELRQDMLARRCNLRGLTAWIEPLDAWLEQMLTTPLRLSGLSDGPPDGVPDDPVNAPVLVLQDLAHDQIQVEMEFWIESRGVDTRVLDRLVQEHCLPGAPRPELRPNQLDGLLKGFIDLVFEQHGRYYLLDWKSNWLGPDDSAYTAEAMRAAVLAHRYDLQYALYLLALHRLLRARLADYDPDRHLGGAVYLFLRGCGAPSQGLFTAKPVRALIEALDRLFSGSGDGIGARRGAVGEMS